MENPQVCSFMNNYNTSTQFSLHDYAMNDPNLSFKSMILENSRKSLRLDNSVQHKSIYSDGVSEIFRVIDRSKLIVCSINRQNVNIKRLNMNEYKTSLNYEKIKLIDLIKLLIISRKDIDAKLSTLENKNYFLKEIENCISNLNMACDNCVEIPINEMELTEEFGLSNDVIDRILYDCGLDLCELDRYISDKMKELDRKLNLSKNAHPTKIQKSRMEQHCEKILLVLQNEICPNLNCINKILDRLFSGHSNLMIDANFFKLSDEELQQYQSEINQSQLYKIVNMKYLLLGMENKVSENIISIRELQIMLHQENNSMDFVENIFSPIRKSSTNSNQDSNIARKLFISSTPATRKQSRNLNYYSILSESKESLHNLNEESISSFDSGYLLTSGNDHSFRDSCEEFDVIPFSDDEYEKITDNDEIIPDIDEDSDLCEFSNTNSKNEIPVDSSSILPSVAPLPINTDFDSKDFCRKNRFCQIDRSDKFLFSSIGHSKEFENNVTVERPLIKFTERINYFNLLEFGGKMINTLESYDKEIKWKITSLIMGLEWESTFNSLLKMSTVKISQNPLDIDVILDGLINLVKFYQSPKTNSLMNYESKSGVGIQLNNSAHTHLICENSVLRNGEQNTNNNADSKDDDYNDFSTTHNDPIDNDDNDESLCLDVELKVAFKSILSDSTSTDKNVDVNNEISNTNQLNDGKFTNYRDVTVNINNTLSDQLSTDWHDNLSINSDISSKDDNRHPESEYIEDIELVVKLSELHLRSEYQFEQYNESAMISNKDKIIENYKNLTSQSVNPSDNNQFNESLISAGEKSDIIDIDMISPDSNILLQMNNSIDEINLNDNCNQTNYSDTLEEINEMRTEYNNNVTTEVSLDLPEKEDEFVKENEFVHDDESMLCSDRISLTINLIEKLLEMTNFRLNFISSLFKKNSSIKSTILHHKSLSICALRQRLTVTIKILTNLKFAIQNTYPIEVFSESFSEIDKLINQSISLTQFSIDIESNMKKNGYEMEKIDCYNFEHELPDDLLIKMEPNDVEMILLISTRRLQITISALSQYPCYNYFQKRTLNTEKPNTEQLLNNSISLNCSVEGLNPSDLLQRLCKLRRITAICALNIVDLHVVLTKLESDGFQDHRSLEDKIKDLLIFWRAVDGECHRLLRCTNLLYHVMTEARKTYVDIVSLLAVMNSILRTVELSSDETETMKIKIDNLMNFKQRNLDWLKEIQICVSIIYQKRITNKRFQYFDEIHNFLEENLNTISELTNNIKNGCSQAVYIVNDIITYCTNLPNCSISEIGMLLITDEWVNNKHLYYSLSKNKEVNENIFNAIIDLEELTMQINNSITNENIKCFSDQFQEYLMKSKDIFHAIYDENPDLILSEKNNSSIISTHVSPTTHEDNQIISEETVVNKATEKIIDKLSRIAAYAATNALLLFVDKYKLKQTNNNDTEQTSMTSISDDDLLKEYCSRIIENVSTSLTFAIIDNISELKHKKLSSISEFVLKDICQELSDRTIFDLVEQVVTDQEVVDEIFITDTSSDIANYLCEALGCLIVNNTLEELRIDDFPANNNIISIFTCISELQNKLFGNLIEKSQIITSDFVDPHVDTTEPVQLSGFDCSNLDYENEFSNDLSILPHKYLNTVPVSSLKQNYDSHEVFKSFTRLFDSKLIISNQYVRKITNVSTFFKCVTNECEVCKPPTKEINLPKNKSNKISHLVAHFNQNSIENSPKKKLPMLKLSLERIFLNMLNLKSLQIVEEIVIEVLKDLKVHNATFQNTEMIKVEKSTGNLNFSEKSIGELISQDSIPTFQIEMESREIVSFSDEKSDLSNKSFEVKIHNSSNNVLEFSESQSAISVNENVTQSENLDSVDLISETISKIESIDDINVNDSINERKSISLSNVITVNAETVIGSDLQLKTTKNTNNISNNLSDGCYSLKNQNFYCGTFSKEEAGISDETYSAEVIIDSDKSKLKIEQIKINEECFNVGEIENQFYYNNDLILPIESTIKRKIEGVLQPKVKNDSTFSLKSEAKFSGIDWRSVKVNRLSNNISDKSIVPKLDLSNSVSNSLKFPEKELHHNNILKTLFVILILILLLVITVFNNGLSQFFNSFTFGQAFYPKFTSSGLPF